MKPHTCFAAFPSLVLLNKSSLGKKCQIEVRVNTSERDVKELCNCNEINITLITSNSEAHSDPRISAVASGSEHC